MILFIVALVVILAAVVGLGIHGYLLLRSRIEVAEAVNEQFAGDMEHVHNCDKQLAQLDGRVLYLEAKEQQRDPEVVS